MWYSEPSFKGALRFWWRSLMWGKVADVAELRQKEAELFGSSDQKIGQSKVRMRLTEVDVGEVASSAAWTQQKGIQYLGYGVMNFRGELSRPMIPGGTFTVQLRLGPMFLDEQIQQIQNALIMLGTVGGLGSKSRKGFGSLTLTSLHKNGEPVELADEPASRISFTVGQRSEGLPDWTAWSNHSRIVKVVGKDRAVELLDLFGKEQVYFRSWGNRGRVIDRDSEQNFREDHDLSKGQSVTIKHPKRIAFGLPHNYGKGDRNAVTTTSKGHDRRASPLFLHVHQTSDGEEPVGIVTFLPAQFLSDGEQVRAFGSNVPLDRSDDFWLPIHGYLDRLLGKENATPKKTNLTAEEITLA